MKKSLIYLLLLVITFSMSACFDVTEEVTIHKDGSGTYISIVDATKLSEQLKSLAMLDSTGTMLPRLRYSLDSTYAETFSRYAKVNGISNVNVDTSETYIYKVSMDFKDITALNEAVNIDKKKEETKNLYAWKNGQLSRKNFAVNLGDMKTDDASQKELAKALLEDMKYTIIFNLPTKATRVSNKSGNLSNDKKKVTMVCNVLDVMDKKVNLGNDVYY